MFVAACAPKHSNRRPTEADELAFVESAKAAAVTAGRRFVTPEDVKKAAPAALRRFVTLTEEGAQEAALTEILANTEVP
jgi:MoxR-like ATPase